MPRYPTRSLYPLSLSTKDCDHGFKMFPINKFRFAIAASNQSSPLADSTSLSRLGALHMYFGHLETDGK